MTPLEALEWLESQDAVASRFPTRRDPALRWVVSRREVETPRGCGATLSGAIEDLIDLERETNDDSLM